ncbi:GMP synthase (glutamine-hydrolysing) [Peptoniphilus asaccharolyticus DSM 20463]|uniref:GMP synthase [glutamine-hydrolyzing] n=1 Tax=Peptoniphilus asaccharolyticus DSM 20463 TaxID=573058 RepID=A0A1W1VDV4_PEPAS|nr:glutamine-hydrolyzing GMP synthase [Peptoniphilus asaccharolyticus]MBL7574603.1 glutamine-hydrolyzing GMP synthase [Peptoniphilus asaccharolyticus]MBL7575588.1 glutamine-hydrolyzing GMP synthase [Peptoniphilus asaccharolyticus]SMB91124.1 GMP synthase (glutamine-hydrolysing) [Peptoniphilus asaccharolyticus DSM 20463]
MILVVDFGGQYNQLIARRIRDLNVYCEVVPYNKALEAIKEKKPNGIVFTGGPNSVYEEGAPSIDKEIFELGIPVLGLCYGMQLMSHVLGGEVKASSEREFGKTVLNISDNKIFDGIKQDSTVWMSHVDKVVALPEGFKTIAKTDNTENAAIANEEKKLYGFQFHPEVNHSEFGTEMLKNFIVNVVGEKQDWTMANYKTTLISSIREKVGDGKVLLALSGGVDSSVAAALLSEAVGENLTCILVDHGLMRKNEAAEVEEAFKDSGMHFIRVDAEERFLKRLEGVTDPEDKRKAIGEEFIRVFEDEGKKIGSVDFLAQGTIYPDIIESGLGDAAVIKSHHNVGGLPSVVDFKDIVEPLRMLFKDEVRQLGRELGLKDYLVNRQPFPGPGLGIRVIGEITKEKLDLLRDADAIFREEIAKAGLDTEINQYFAVLTNNRTVGVMGDFRTYDYTLALRAVKTTDFMTADWSRIPYDVLDKVSVRIVNEVKNINRIVYDITSKPPATIEWE